MVLLPSPPLVVAITLKEWFPGSSISSPKGGEGPFEAESIVCYYLLLRLYPLKYVGPEKKDTIIPGQKCEGNSLLGAWLMPAAW